MFSLLDCYIDNLNSSLKLAGNKPFWWCDRKREDELGGSRVLTVVMDGVGINDNQRGNAVSMARTPCLDFLRSNYPSTTLLAHGTAVGLPSDSDMGNSEVGHNALGAGRIYDQGAKLVNNAFSSGRIWSGDAWGKLVTRLKSNRGTLHLIGLFSDGNIHSHIDHTCSLITQAKKDGLSCVRLHLLLDGRDVPAKSAELYLERLESMISQVVDSGFDVKVASGGGRMSITMDRYGADWDMVKRGWWAHVHGEAPFQFTSCGEAIDHFRKDEELIDQYIPAFVIIERSEPVGRIMAGDAVIFTNFRGDRSIEISRAFTEESFDEFDRGDVPDVFYSGMMEYDADLKIPENYLVEPPLIIDTMGEFLAAKGIRQFACSETQKFGHVTFFWNGNRSGMFDPLLETYVEVPSDQSGFDRFPWMKAREITEEAIKAMSSPDFRYGRINYANGDMVGHTGNFDAAVLAVSVVDLMLGLLLKACNRTGTILMVTADHGNCDEMFEKVKVSDSNISYLHRPKPKTSHTLHPVPFCIYDPRGPEEWKLNGGGVRSLGNVAGTVCALLGIEQEDRFLPSIVRKR